MSRNAHGMYQNDVEQGLPSPRLEREKSRQKIGSSTEARRWSLWATLLPLALIASPIIAQTAPAATPLAADTEAALHSMSRLAAIIFAGQVVAIHREPASSGASGIVAIEFAVEDAVRGVNGRAYTLREWAALWSATDPPFRVGQRYLMLLHAPSAGGLSSPVGGMDGAIPIQRSPESWGASASAKARVTSSQTDGSVVDLRWIATRIEQPVSYRVEVLPSRPSAPAHPSVTAANSKAPAQTPASTAESVQYSALIAALRTWVKDDDAAR
jgi:hypothetical protein